jgi:chorismate synthase
MMRWGTRFEIAVFGSSHGPEVGVVVTGLPGGTRVDLVRMQRELDRRRPVGRRLSTRRQEEDLLEVDAGISAGRATGEPIRIHVANNDVRSGPYDAIRATPRPGHADYPARVRFGATADLSGGGIFSGRMTVGLVIAGCLARELLEPKGIRLAAFVRSIGPVDANVPDDLGPEEILRGSVASEIGTPDISAARRMEACIEDVRRDGDSVGGVIETRVTGLPVGLGEPFFDSVESAIAHLALAVPAVKGVEFGAGFSAARMRGSEHNDPFVFDATGQVTTRTNRAGGILGGLTVGTPLVYRVAVKPTSSIAREQETVDLERRVPARLKVTGRHDPCIVPRAVPVLEAVTAVALAELGLRGGFLP